jgi:endoglucanase
MTAQIHFLPRNPAVRSLLAALVSATLLFAAAPAWAGTANAGVANARLADASAGNPLTGMRWGIYTGPTDNVYPAYEAASGRNRQLMAKIALRPLAFWFGSWFSDTQARATAQQYIANVTGGDPSVLSQIAVFRLDPWEGQACPGSWNAANQASYRTWIDNFASGIGSARVALILQPDLPFALCAPSRVPLALVNYAARQFSALPHTTVYVDAGADWWPAKASQAASMLDQAGVRYARGFALNSTEYDSTGSELEVGDRIERALSARGIRGKHFVVNTAENGSPFLNGQYPGNADNARVCRSPQDRLCATLGIPPTTNTASRRWGLSAHDRGIAARYADAYLWVGRPWLDNASWPFDLQRALGLAASTPF